MSLHDVSDVADYAKKMYLFKYKFVYKKMNWSKIIWLEYFLGEIKTEYSLTFWQIPQRPATIIIPGLIKMSAFDWSMTRWYKTHGSYVTSLGGLYVAMHDVKMV